MASVGIKYWPGEQETFVIIYRSLWVLFHTSSARVCSLVVLKTSVKVRSYLGISWIGTALSQSIVLNLPELHRQFNLHRHSTGRARSCTYCLNSESGDKSHLWTVHPGILLTKEYLLWNVSRFPERFFILLYWATITESNAPKRFNATKNPLEHRIDTASHCHYTCFLGAGSFSNFRNRTWKERKRNPKLFFQHTAKSTWNPLIVLARFCL
jgi:hypothetical protein